MSSINEAHIKNAGQTCAWNEIVAPTLATLSEYGCHVKQTRVGDNKATIEILPAEGNIKELGNPQTVVVGRTTYKSLYVGDCRVVWET